MRTIIIILLVLASSLSYGQESGLYKFRASNGKYGFMDKTGKIKIKAEYLNVSEFSEGLCYVSKEIITKGYKWIFIDTIGNKVFDIKDNFPQTKFSNGFARISSFEEHWFINKNGVNEFGKTWKDGNRGFKDGIAYVSDKKFTNFYKINTKGEKVDNKTFSFIEIYQSRKDSDFATKKTTQSKSDEYVPFQKNKLWGFKDKNENVIIEPKFYLVDKFENGICAVRTKEVLIQFANDYFLDAIIDENGKIITEVEMHCYMGFQGDLIEYYGGHHFSGGIHYLDKNGKKIIPTK